MKSLREMLAEKFEDYLIDKVHGAHIDSTRLANLAIDVVDEHYMLQQEEQWEKSQANHD